MKLLRVAAALVFTGLFAACSFAPKYNRPDLPVPQQFADTTASADTIPADWWTAFGDTTLNALVDEALRNNQDLFAAADQLPHNLAFGPA